MKYIVLFLALFMFPPLALAQDNADEGLYDPLPPEGSAFVRVVNADAKSKALDMTINGQERTALQFQGVSPYYVAKAGDVAIKAGDVQTSMDAAAGKFYTAVFDGTFFVLEDTPNTDPTKSLIQFYNLSAHEQLSLKTADGKLQIVEPTPIAQNSHRQINAVKLETALYKGENALGGVSAVNLKRGRVHSAFISAPSDEIHWVMNSTDTSP